MASPAVSDSLSELSGVAGNCDAKGDGIFGANGACGGEVESKVLESDCRARCSDLSLVSDGATFAAEVLASVDPALPSDEALAAGKACTLGCFDGESVVDVATKTFDDNAWVVVDDSPAEFASD